MNIRAKITLVVLPLLMSALLITGIVSTLSARSGLTRVAMKFLGFKAQELEKNMQNQWNLLVENDLAENEEYVDVAKNAVLSYALSIIRSETEVILAVDREGQAVLETTETKIRPSERRRFENFFMQEKTGWTEFALNGEPKVGYAFIFSPFDWYVVVSEDEEAFYREVSQIFNRNMIIMGISILVSILLLIFFSGYLTRPLKRVVAAMRDIISYNDLSKQVDVEFKDEIGRLAHTFNLMIKELDSAYKQIKEFAFKAVLAQKNEHKIRNIFQKYVPKDIIDTFFNNPESMLVGDNRVLAILFSDIRSFTTISEGFMPDELVNALNRYFTMMVDIIMGHRGIIDKYIGDAIMAFFGAPVKHKDDAEQAVLAALEMQEALVEFNKEQKKAGKPAFVTGIGINYGIVTVGNIGSEKKMDYTIIGDMVNLGSRLEGLTKPYRQNLIFSESVYKKVKNTVPCRMVDKVVVKGKTQGEKIFTAVRKLSTRQKKAWDIHHAALKSYYARDFEKASSYFENVDKLLSGDYLSKLYIERCEHYQKSPPTPDWNGTEILTSK